uniref:Uncharacterized protein n=1 Tax=Helianthus annuus TaxID=4232 RepID=A0A251V0Y3_HELAN
MDKKQDSDEEILWFSKKTIYAWWFLPPYIEVCTLTKKIVDGCMQFKELLFSSKDFGLLWEESRLASCFGLSCKDQV